MSDRKPCVRCSRSIDEWAKTCVFCGWNQAIPPLQLEQEQNGTSAPAYQVPKEHRMRNRLLVILAFFALVIVAFSAGTRIHGFDAPKQVAKNPAANQPRVVVNNEPAPSRSDLQVGPSQESTGPLTSAPVTATVAGIPAEYQRTDATAATSVEYAQLAARTPSESQPAADPRTLRGSFDGASPRPMHRQHSDHQSGAHSVGLPPMMSSNGGVGRTERRPSPVVKTRAVPEYQPVPRISVSTNTTARLDLTIGADGQVKEVTVVNGLPGQNVPLIAAVQRWKFRPATENGAPVASNFAVDISFNANE